MSMVIEGLINQPLRWYGMGFAPATSSYKPLVEYVQSISDRQVVMTGHSLGGGLAHIVGGFTSKGGLRTTTAAAHVVLTLVVIGTRQPLDSVLATWHHASTAQAADGPRHPLACPKHCRSERERDS